MLREERTARQPRWHLGQPSGAPWPAVAAKTTHPLQAERLFGPVTPPPVPTPPFSDLSNVNHFYLAVAVMPLSTPSPPFYCSLAPSSPPQSTHPPRLPTRPVSPSSPITGFGNHCEAAPNLGR